MLSFDPERVQANIQKADTEDLLDRVTVYQAGMEPQALEMIEAELEKRGIPPEQIAAHAQQRAEETFPRPDGTVYPCSFCHNPAVDRGWGWHWKWRILPLFPWFFYYCREHQPGRHPKSEKRNPKPIQNPKAE